MDNVSASKPCPWCGYCPTCGHRPAILPTYPIYPWPQYPWGFGTIPLTPNPYITWTVTSGDPGNSTPIAAGNYT